MQFVTGSMTGQDTFDKAVFVDLCTIRLCSSQQCKSEFLNLNVQLQSHPGARQQMLTKT